MDGLARPPDSSVQVFTAEERPDLWQQARPLFSGVWPEYNLHGNHSGKYFGQLFPQHARFQVLVYDSAAGRVVGRGRAIPFRGDGSLEDLPAGIDAVGMRAVAEQAAPTAVSALAAEVEQDRQGHGLSRLILQAMALAGRNAGLGPLVARSGPAGKISTRSSRSTRTPGGVAATACRSIPGCACMPGSGPRSCAASRAPWRSRRPLRIVSGGPAWSCRSLVSTCSLAGWRRSR